MPGQNDLTRFCEETLMYARSIPKTFAFVPARPVRLSLMARLALMVRTAQTRRDLTELDGRMLADIGVTRSDALVEAARPVWDTACRAGRPLVPVAGW